MKNMELRQLRYFSTVAELENLSAAAKALHISQPPLGRQIRQLEEQLGLQLFEHSQRRIRLTPTGRDFWVSVRALLAQAEQLQQHARRLRAGQTGQVVLGYVPVAMYSGLLPDALRRLHEMMPEVNVQLLPLASHDLHHLLDTGELDLCLLHHPVKRVGYTCRVGRGEQMCVVAAEHHEVAQCQQVDAAMAAQLHWIAMPRSQPGLPEDELEVHIRQRFEQACAAAGFTPQVSYESVDTVTVLSLVRAGLAVTLAHPSIVRQMAGLVARPVTFIDIQPRLYLISRKAGASAAARSLGDLLAHSLGIA